MHDALDKAETSRTATDHTEMLIELLSRGTTSGLVAPCRYAALLGARPVWSPATHGRFLPSFGVAVRTVLLAAHRCGSEGAARLPREVLETITGHAAYPMACWVDIEHEIRAPLNAAGLGQLHLF